MNASLQASETVTSDICKFISRTTIKSVPPAVREVAKLHLLDGLATMLGGANEEASRILRRRFQPKKKTGDTTVLGAPNKFSAERAALINGVQGHVLDYDDAQLATLASRPTGQQTHPTAPVLAAVLALAETRRASGAALLASYIVGVEVACRLGDAIDPSHYLDGFHPTGTLGTFGAAAACAHLLKLKPRSIRYALGIAGTLAAGLRANRGTMAKGLNAGHAAENGVIAASLAGGGFTASENIFDDPMGFFSATCGGQVSAGLLQFGKPFFFAQPGIAIKLYPCAGVLHPMLDVTRDLRERYGIEAQNVEQIRVSLDASAALPLVYEKPQNSLQSKFSLNFAVAVAIVDGDAGLKQFTTARVRDAKVQKIMKRVELVRLPTRKEKQAIGIKTEVEIRMRDGTIHRGHVAVGRGHPTLPASRAEIEEKFRQCADAILPAKTITKFLKTFWTLDRVPSVAAWLRPLRPNRR